MTREPNRVRAKASTGAEMADVIENRLYGKSGPPFGEMAKVATCVNVA
jgi:hypothetical protein